MDLENSSAKDVGYKKNKDVIFKKIKGIYIKKFRSLSNRQLQLGDYFTLITGKNGTMKSTLLGLIVHPFSSPNDAKDLFDKPLKTTMKDVFRLSTEKDKEKYTYYLLGDTTSEATIAEQIRIYVSKLNPEEKDANIKWRHRVTVGKDNTSGLGNFSLNTRYLNLKRLYPIIETEPMPIDIELSDEEKKFVSKAYARIMQRDEYQSFEEISGLNSKNTCAPTNTYYDFNSISSGEDNLGAIISTLIAFMRNKLPDYDLQGIICIDEIEASLHPVAQKFILEFLFYWAKKHHIQIIATTHSLFLTEQFLELQKNHSPQEATLVNISTQQVGDDNNFKFMINPDFKTIYKELTYSNPSEESTYKVNILCEDDVATKFLKRVIKSKSILNNINFISNVGSDKGTSWPNYVALAKNAPNILSDSIIILDPDVPQNSLDNLSFKYITKIPDPDNYAIEKRIAKYVYELNGDNILFSDYEKKARQAELLSYHVDFTGQDISPFKKWYSDNKSFFNKAMKQYIENNNILFSQFKLQILEQINEKRKNFGLPALTL